MFQIGRIIISFDGFHRDAHLSPMVLAPLICCLAPCNIDSPPPPSPISYMLGLHRDGIGARERGEGTKGEGGVCNLFPSTTTHTKYIRYHEERIAILCWLLLRPHPSRISTPVSPRLAIVG